MKDHSIEIFAHQELTGTNLGELRQLFDSEYLKEYGEWDPEQPYGYASHDAHVIAAEMTDAHPEIAWPQIRGFRNILVHQYFGVDIEMVRDVVETQLPPLADVLRSRRGDV